MKGRKTMCLPFCHDYVVLRSSHKNWRGRTYATVIGETEAVDQKTGEFLRPNNEVELLTSGAVDKICSKCFKMKLGLSKKMKKHNKRATKVFNKKQRMRELAEMIETRRNEARNRGLKMLGIVD